MPLSNQGVRNDLQDVEQAAVLAEAWVLVPKLTPRQWALQALARIAAPVPRF